MTPPLELIQLSHDLGKPAYKFVIIGEGNTSLRENEETFWIKASGHQMPTITPQGFAQIRFAPILALFDNPPQTTSAQRLALRAALVDDTHADPSVETSFHAMLLHDCGVNCIAHTHPVAVNRLLCSAQAETFARRRIYPDEVVLCGPESVFVPYVDPGLPLAIAMRKQVHLYMDQYGEAPKVVLMANHGLIALGQTTTEALNITMMADKAAEILWGALQLGDVPFMSKEDVMHIYKRPDEIYRRQQFVN
jgi:rhamnose utilization protein RhaD (predicted bifunctional aldolase and dehydrogenase)